MATAEVAIIDPPSLYARPPLYFPNCYEPNRSIPRSSAFFLWISLSPLIAYECSLYAVLRPDLHYGKLASEERPWAAQEREKEKTDTGHHLLQTSSPIPCF